MKFNDMQYTRPNLEALKITLSELTEKLRHAETYEEAREVFLEEQTEWKHVMTMSELVMIRHSIDTRDTFYEEEQNFMNSAMPELQEYTQKWTLAMLESPFRDSFAEEYGELMFTNAALELKTFTPTEEFISALQQENNLTDEYSKLVASASIPFENGNYTISQMAPFKTSSDDQIRLAAWKAEGKWYKENQAELDEIYDQLVHLRDNMGRMLGYNGYTELGYYRMGRNCYTREDIEKFRDAVVKYVVPVADGIYHSLAVRLGKEYPLSFADSCLQFRSGNPKPAGDEKQTLAAGMKFYDELSPETGKFFRMMLDNDLLNVLSTEGKQAGGYCTELPDYEVPFIFANFNGTQHDVEVITHEAGHAFEAWLNAKRIPVEYCWPSMEACEVHSMSMEFFAEIWAEDFFGEDARKYRYSHLADALTFIPYGTMVDHFQHIVYDHPEMKPSERHETWRSLLSIYMPWMKLDGEIPFYSDGEGWQRQLHIYTSPFYYIDYCLAQTVALEFWRMIREDIGKAWETYMSYTVMGGSETFRDLLDKAALKSPFDSSCLRDICQKANEVLESFDLSGIE